MTGILDINGLPYMRVGDITTDVVTSLVSFPNLDIGKDDHYVLVVDVINNLSGTGPTVMLMVNNNVTATDYQSQSIISTGSTPSASRGNAANFMDFDTVQYGKVQALVDIHLTTAGYFAALSHTIESYESATLIHIRDYYLSSTFTMNSINTLSVVCATANAIGVGSRFQLYKLMAEKVVDVIVTTPTSSVDITNLNINKDSEYLIICDCINATASNYNLSPYINGDVVTTDYYSQELNANTTTLTAARTNDARLARVSGTGSVPRALFIASIKLSNSGHLMCKSHGIRDYGAASPYFDDYYVYSTFTVTSITQLTLTSDVASAIGSGSRFTLYKLK